MRVKGLRTLILYDLQSAKVKEILQEQEQSGRIIGAICAGKENLLW